MKKVITFTAVIAMLLTAVACNTEEFPDSDYTIISTITEEAPITTAPPAETTAEVTTTEPRPCIMVPDEGQSQFCYRFTLDLQLMENISDMSEIVPKTEEEYDETLSGFILWALHNGAEEGNEEAFYRVLEETLGVTDYDLKKSSMYREYGKDMLVTPGAGGMELFYKVDGVFEDSEGNYCVDISYCTDEKKDVVAKAVRYHLTENGSSYKMTSVEELYVSNSPVGIIIN